MVLKFATMRASYQIQEEDVLEANKTFSASSGQMTVFVIMLFLLSFVGAYLLDKGYQAAAIGWLGVTACLALALYWLPIRSMRRALRTASILGVPIVADITESGTAFTLPTGKSEFQWEHYRKFSETRRCFLLFRAEYHYSLIAKSGMTPSEISEVRNLIARHLPTSSSPGRS